MLTHIGINQSPVCWASKQKSSFIDFYSLRLLVKFCFRNMFQKRLLCFCFFPEIIHCSLYFVFVFQLKKDILSNVGKLIPAGGKISSNTNIIYTVKWAQAAIEHFKSPPSCDDEAVLRAVFTFQSCENQQTQSECKQDSEGKTFSHWRSLFWLIFCL